MSAAALVALALVGVALAAAACVWAARARSLVGRVGAVALWLLAYLVAPWFALSVWLRPLSGVALVGALGIGLRRRRVARPPSRRRWAQLALVAPLVVLDVAALAGLRPGGRALPIASPLRGRAVVVQGGASTITNHWHARSGQLYAVDLELVDAWGRRAHRLFPTENDDYVSFGAPVLAPCDGLVALALDGVADNRPPRANAAQHSGNHVVLRCHGSERRPLLLCHLRNGSLRVHAGQRVTVGQPLAAVGNSGDTIEPHVHVAAYEGEVDGPSVPLLVEGRFLSTPSIVDAR